MKRWTRFGIWGLVLFVVLVVFPSYRVYHYVQHDPRFCTSCHLMDDAFDRWSDNEHSKIECHACHVSDLKGNLTRLYYSVVNPKSEIETHAHVDKTVCLKCHESNTGERWSHVLSTRGHHAHLTRSKKLQCVDCHSDGLHKRVPPVNVCLRCHETVAVHEGMERLECLDCHNFLAETGTKMSSRPTGNDCRTCHEENGTRKAENNAKRFSIASVHAGLECARCHNPHATEKAEARSGTNCTRCHRGFDKVLEQGPDAEPHQKCKSCHEPHAPRDSADKKCQGCHPKHPGPMKERHNDRCTTCHKPHQFRADRLDCSACHSEMAKAMYAAAPKEHGSCIGCHDPHGDLPNSRNCEGCHRPIARQVLKAGPRPHRGCVWCHEPHQGKPKRAAACSKCHEVQVKGVATSARKEHRNCKQCHPTEHGSPEVGAKPCAGCHRDKANVATQSFVPAPHQKCGSCHELHARELKPDLERCRKCHVAEAAGAAGDPHGGDCRKCHEIHGFPRAKVANCKACHPGVSITAGRGGAKHQDCRSCHVPHGTRVLPIDRCENCHDALVKRTQVWADVAPPHTRCDSCHVGHDARARKPCGSCHPTEANLAQGTKHERCTDCHSPHESRAVGKDAWRASCNRCHRSIEEAVTTRGPTHGTCRNCHTPHAIKPPSCEDCHAAIRSQLMHSVEGHTTKCDACHATHESRTGDKKRCFACHADKQKHFPEAARCDNCHPFAPSGPR